MSTLFRTIGDTPFDIKIPAGVPYDIAFRAIGFRNVAVSFKVSPGHPPCETVEVYLGNTGDFTIDVIDPVASAALSPLATVRLFQDSAIAVGFVSFRITSAGGSAVHITSSGD